MKTVKVKIACFEGDVMMVLNYRKRPAEWEMCAVLQVSAHFDFQGDPHTQYEVITERKMDSGRGLRLTVGPDGIRSL